MIWATRIVAVSFLVAGCSGGGGGNGTGGTGTDTDPSTSSPTTSTTAPTSSTTDDSTSTSSATATDSDTTGSTTGPNCPAPQPTNGDYTPCTKSFCAGGGVCATDSFETFEVCTRGCLDVCNCWPKPEGDFTAEPACKEAVYVGLDCWLDCSGGKTCPDGMMCQADFEVCVYPPSPPFPGGGDTSTSTGTSTSTSTSG